MSVCVAQTSATALNEGSSRSHTVLRVSIESSPRAVDGAQGGAVLVTRTLSALHLIDLAGSESARVQAKTLNRIDTASSAWVTQLLVSVATLWSTLLQNPDSYINSEVAGHALGLGALDLLAQAGREACACNVAKSTL